MQAFQGQLGQYSYTGGIPPGGCNEVRAAEQAHEEHEAQLRRKDAEAEKLGADLQRAHALAQEAAAQAEAARKAAQRLKARLLRPSSWSSLCIAPVPCSALRATCLQDVRAARKTGSRQ